MVGRHKWSYSPRRRSSQLRSCSVCLSEQAVRGSQALGHYRRWGEEALPHLTTTWIAATVVRPGGVEGGV